MENLDRRTVEGFGDEWSRFDQVALSAEEREQLFGQYFAVFPWQDLPTKAVGVDVGCGSGRWAKHVAPRVDRLICVDASEDALAVARRSLSSLPNCEFLNCSVGEMPIPDASLDFGYSLGVLHHVPDTRAAITACVRKLKPGAPFLLYLYYAFDNRPSWFRVVWQVSDLGRRVISRLPYPVRFASSQAIASAVYWPLARAARVLEQVGVDVSHMPLAGYRERSFYVMRTDALDRFGTPLEQRFTREQMLEMMKSSGLERITFSDKLPFWCAVGYRVR